MHASSLAPLLAGLLATCHVCSTRSTLPSPATLFQTSHPTPITQFEASWRGQDRVCRQHDVHLWPAWGGALARGPTGRAPCGPLRLALRWPLVRSPPARLPPPACTGRRSACQADGHRGVAATRGVTLWPAGRLPWWTSAAGTARAGRARSRLAGLAWSGAPFGGSAPPNPCQPKRTGGRLVFYCRAVCRAGTGSGRVLPPLSARPDAGVNAAVDGPWQRCVSAARCCGVFLPPQEAQGNPGGATSRAGLAALGAHAHP